MMEDLGSAAMTPRSFVVLVSGCPGAGKTTLGWELSRRLHVPFVSRDDVKTGLHVTHRSTDPEEVWRFAELAFDIFFDTVRRLVERGVSVVAEAAFHAGPAEESIAELSRSSSVIHLPLTTAVPVALERYTQRARLGHRHPAHNDEEFAKQMADGTKDVGVYRVALPYPTLPVDGSAGWNPGIDEIVDFVEQSR